MPTTPATATRPPRVRHEGKFVVPQRFLPVVEAVIEHVCAPDPRFRTNIIKSLYFDTQGLDLLRQKRASELLKKKVRIRWYVDPQSGAPGPEAYLEIKCKDGVLVRECVQGVGKR